jgi:arylsulfatase A-like enzyme
MNIPECLLKLTPLALIGALFLAVGSCAKRLDKPHLILISVDCLNHRQFKAAIDGGAAPFLIELKKESTYFARSYSHAPWTTPAHLSLLSGLYPSQHGYDVPYGLMIAWNEYNPRLPLFMYVGDHLMKAGYLTAAFVGSGNISQENRWGFKLFDGTPKNSDNSDLEEICGKVECWIAQRQGKPVFVFLHTNDFHLPRPKGCDSDEAAIRQIDRQLGAFFAKLKAMDVYDDSLIILTGDHGSNMVEAQGKCCLHGAGHYEENLHVPLLVKFPHSSQRGEERFIARHIDVLPTVLDVAGLPAAGYKGPGESLLRRLKNKRREADRVVYSYSEADGRCASRHAVVTDRYKYIYTPKDHTQALLQGNSLFFDFNCPEICRNLPIEEFYDLQTDPFEKRNLFLGKLSRPERDWFDKLRLEMTKDFNLPHYYEVVVIPGPKTKDDLKNEELQRQLRTLGYIR